MSHIKAFAFTTTEYAFLHELLSKISVYDEKTRRRDQPKVLKEKMLLN